MADIHDTVHGSEVSCRTPVNHHVRYIVMGTTLMHYCHRDGRTYVRNFIICLVFVRKANSGTEKHTSVIPLGRTNYRFGFASTVLPVCPKSQFVNFVFWKKVGFFANAILVNFVFWKNLGFFANGF